MKLKRFALMLGTAICFALTFAATPALAHEAYCNRDCTTHHAHIYADNPLIRGLIRDIIRLEDRIQDLDRRRDDSRRYRDGRDNRRIDDDIRDAKRNLDERRHELSRVCDDFHRRYDQDWNRGRDRRGRDYDDRGRGRDYDDRGRSRDRDDRGRGGWRP
ncbi:MAG: hypothetical protein ABJA67_03775 [Chthonomonadales bacterium]